LPVTLTVAQAWDDPFLADLAERAYPKLEALRKQLKRQQRHR
jgi:hypothetical protein